jgi:leucyl-tRNA synthetase
MNPYDFKSVEQKWQKKNKELDLYKNSNETDKPKHYVLDMFPYPSGEGLHVGHTRIYTASDIYTRMKRMQGFNMLHPTGWDAFGLPAELYAIKNKVNPSISVRKNIDTFRKQMKMLDLSYDFSREVNTTDPSFYKWTQWIFLKMHEKGLAYESFEPINWCPSCQTGLANEDLEGGKCERCGSEVIKKPMRQWVLKIREYADRLVDDLDTLPLWPNWLKELQRNWIGRSEGAEFIFTLTGISGQADGKHTLRVFTTRPDTMYGVNFVAVSAELAQSWLDAGWDTGEEVKHFIHKHLQAQNVIKDFKTELEKEGVATGIYAQNPATGENVPVWIANYVLGGVGTGAIMGVPAHDQRDFEFAKKYNLTVKPVIAPETGEPQVNPEFRKSIVAILVNKKNNTILSINWGEKNGGNLFIGGGLDEGEDIIECAKREIQEETGYINVKYVSKTGLIHHNYFAHSKNVARRIEATGLLFELENEEMTEQALEENEKGKFTFEWIEEKEAETKVKDALHSLVYKQLVKGEAYERSGTLINSDKFDGMSSDEAKEKIIVEFGGVKVTKYRLEDWVFSRQRYWGEPIPMVHDEDGKPYPVDESELPVLLPEVESYAPTGTGESPLADIKDWVEVTGYITEKGTFKKSIDGKIFKRETNTMPQWAGSSWYYLRFLDPSNDTMPFDKNLEKYWMPVDVYVGGAEHATRHLIYARFWHKFLYDNGVVSTLEPFMRIESVGLVLGEGGVKMSKRLGNVINPDDVIARWGTDVTRTYVAFMGSFYDATAWDEKSMTGCKRFLERVWKTRECVTDLSSKKVKSMVHKTIKKVTEDIDVFKFNTAISQMMICLNLIEEERSIGREEWSDYVRILAPFATSLSEELWENLGNAHSVHVNPWPAYDPALVLDENVIITLQIDGKMRGTFEMLRNSEENDVLQAAKTHEMYKKYVGDTTPKKVVYVKNRLINIVI